MPAVWYGGVPWAPTTLDRAVEYGVADDLSEIALRYRAGRGGVSSWPNPGPRGGVRVADGEHVVIVSDLRVVVGFSSRPVEDVEPAPAPRAAPAPQARKKARKAVVHGPKSYDELVSMLKAEGYVVAAPGGSGHPKVLDRSGNQVAVISSTPSDFRSLHNDIANLRRVLGVRLRRPGR